jgi:hypothetical protein
MPTRNASMIGWLALALVGGCRSSEPSTPETRAVATPLATAPPAATPAQNTPAASGSNFGPVSLAPGFAADPHVVEGTAGGTRSATELGGGCAGYISDRPGHLFVSDGDFGALRVMAWAEMEDLTLVIQRPDGSYVCNDDAEATDPMVMGAFGRGTYKIWVGTYAAGSTPAYRLGFSELPAITPSRIGRA